MAEYAEAIGQLCGDDAAREAVAERCQARAREFGIGVMAAKYDEVYRSLKN